ncbi:MAG: hypothetical protein ACREVZ_13010 [Burkholderiales bacterium]
MSSVEAANLLGRMMVAFYFLWAAWFNIKTKDQQLAELKRIGMPMRRAALVVGLMLQLAGSLLLLYAHTVVIGGMMLIVFLIAADLMFHRFWTYPDPVEQTNHRFFLYEHIALTGGILGLIGSHL